MSEKKIYCGLQYGMIIFNLLNIVYLSFSGDRERFDIWHWKAFSSVLLFLYFSIVEMGIFIKRILGVFSVFCLRNINQRLLSSYLTIFSKASFLFQYMLIRWSMKNKLITNSCLVSKLDLAAIIASNLMPQKEFELTIPHQ